MNSVGRPRILFLTLMGASLLPLSLAADPTLDSHSTLLKRVQDFVEFPEGEKLVTRVQEMESQGLMQGSSAQPAWSGDYWPLRFGGIASTYGDGYRPGISGFFSHSANRARFEGKWSRLDPYQLTPEDLEALSPAEKLDLVVSDYALTFSRNVWAGIGEHSERVSRIKLWEGVCHGWSTAAIDAPRPVKKIWVRSRDGRYLIPFNPDDVKGLSSWLWANSLALGQPKTAGRRCRTTKLQFNPVTGMSNNPDCNGVDPEVFHLALVNLMGVKKESFVINKNNDTKIWNQPLKSYRFQWFNVRTGEVGTLEESLAPIETVSLDVRRSLRSPQTRYLVGVETDIEYVKETRPSRREWDSPENDKVRTLHYRYDLELDEQMRVIGGEWRNFRTDEEAVESSAEKDMPDFPGYPGFIWKRERGARAVSIDADLEKNETWDVNDPIPESFLERSRQAAGFRYMVFEWTPDGQPVWDEHGHHKVKSRKLRPQPLSVIVHGLLRAAKDPADPRTPH